MSAHELAYTRRTGFAIDYGREVEEEIAQLQREIDKYPAIQQRFPGRWLALQLLEQDTGIQGRLRDMENGPALLSEVDKSITHLTEV